MEALDAQSLHCLRQCNILGRTKGCRRTGVQIEQVRSHGTLPFSLALSDQNQRGPMRSAPNKLEGRRVALLSRNLPCDLRRAVGPCRAFPRLRGIIMASHRMSAIEPKSCGQGGCTHAHRVRGANGRLPAGRICMHWAGDRCGTVQQHLCLTAGAFIHFAICPPALSP